MATLFKKQFTKPLPPDAKIVFRTVNGKSTQFAQWIDRKGKRRLAELTANGDRITTDAGTWTAK
jgi:hypothetical protein